MNIKIFFGSFIAIMTIVTFLFIFTGCISNTGADANLTTTATLPTSTIPPISGLTDARGIALDGAKDVAFSSLNLKFDKAVDLGALTASGNVGITCNNLPASVPQPSFIIEAADNDADDGIIGNEFKIEVEDAYKYQLLDCTLSLKNTANQSVSKADTSDGSESTFTNGCAVSTDFNAGDKETDCHIFGGIPSLAAVNCWTSWTDAFAAMVFKFDAPHSELIYDTSYNDFDLCGATFGKRVKVAGDFTAMIHYKFSGIDYAPENTPDFVMMTITDPSGTGYYLGILYAGKTKLPVQSCVAMYLEQGAPDEFMSGNTEECLGDEYYLKLEVKASDKTVFAYWSIDGQNWNQLKGPLNLGPSPGEECQNPKDWCPDGLGDGKLDQSECDCGPCYCEEDCGGPCQGEGDNGGGDKSAVAPDLIYNDMRGSRWFGVMVNQNNNGLNPYDAQSPISAEIYELTIDGVTSETQY